MRHIKDLSPLLQSLASKFTPTRVEVPGFDGAIGVQLLSEEHIDAARVEAMRYLERETKRSGIDARRWIETDAELYERAKVRELIWRAFLDLTDASAPQALFSSAADILALDADSVSALFAVYCDHAERLSAMSSLADATVAELLTATRSQPASLALLPPDALRAFVRAVVARLPEAVEEVSDGS